MDHSDALFNQSAELRPLIGLLAVHPDLNLTLYSMSPQPLLHNPRAGIVDVLGFSLRMKMLFILSLNPVQHVPHLPCSPARSCEHNLGQLPNWQDGRGC